MVGGEGVEEGKVLLSLQVLLPKQNFSSLYSNTQQKIK